MYALLTFIPQWAVIVSAGLLFHYDLFFALVIQTWAFVAFNKVMTAQYFLWYISLMPFLAINNGIIHRNWKLGLALYLGQIGYMILWGKYAFDLEFFGVNNFYILNTVNYIFFAINCASIAIVSREHQLTVTFEISGKNTLKGQLKKVDDK